MLTSVTEESEVAQKWAVSIHIQGRQRGVLSRVIEPSDWKKGKTIRQQTMFTPTCVDVITCMPVCSGECQPSDIIDARSVYIAEI
jgi:hypothetical protein